MFPSRIVQTSAWLCVQVHTVLTVWARRLSPGVGLLPIVAGSITQELPSAKAPVHAGRCGEYVDHLGR
jgi:hypothetical protein